MQLTLLVAAPALPPLAVIAVRPQPAALALAAAAAVLIAAVVAARLRALAGARVERERGRAERRAHALAAQSTEVVAVIGGDGTIVEVGPSAERLWGYPSGVLRGKAAEGLIHPEEAARFRGYLGEVAAGTVGGFLHLRIRRADGTYGQVEVVAADRRQDPEIAGLVVVCRMSGEGTTVESQLVHHAFHDPLTELPNRALFADRLEHALARRERREGVVAVVVLDLDDFRSVNQGLGHAAGDELLVAVGQRISSCLREGDTAARLGGDEFALLLDTVSDAFGLSAVAERIREVLQLPLTIGEEAVAVSASMGMALAEPDTTAPRLVAQARSAMELAKSNGKGRAELFLAVRPDRALSRLELKAELARALPSDAVFLLYQPIVDLRSSRLVGAEALVRWRHPVHGVLDPSQFLPIADEAGLAVPLGRRLLIEACQAARRWRTTSEEAAAVYVGVNVSATQLDDPHFLADIRRALERAPLEPDALVLEVSEGVAMADPHALLELAGRLRRLGVRLAIDDFGTGSGSTAYLQHVRVDQAKIDGTFVGELGRGSTRPTTMSGLLGLTRTLGLTPVAEGVEEEWQRAELLDLGCVYGQGRLFSPPVDADRIATLLAGSA